MKKAKNAPVLAKPVKVWPLGPVTLTGAPSLCAKLPKIGWAGVFAVAIAFDLTAAALAFFVLRRMELPTTRLVTIAVAPGPGDEVTPRAVGAGAVADDDRAERASQLSQPLLRRGRRAGRGHRSSTADEQRTDPRRR